MYINLRVSDISPRLKNIAKLSAPMTGGVKIRYGRSFSPFLLRWRSTNEPITGSLIASQILLIKNILPTFAVSMCSILMQKYRSQFEI